MVRPDTNWFVSPLISHASLKLIYTRFDFWACFGKTSLDRVITRRGTKANQTPERKTIFELFSLLLGRSHQTRILTNDVVCKMTNSGKVTTKRNPGT